MSFRRLVPAVSLLAVFTMATRVSVANDTWWHLRAGEWMIRTGAILRTDPFSLTRFGEPWVYPGWLAQVLLYETFVNLGMPGLNLLTAVFVTLAFACLWRAMQGPQLLRAFVLLLSAAASGVYWSARPQILTFALTGLTILILERTRSGSHRTVFWLPLVLAVWANVHGGFAVGLLLIGIYLLGEVADVMARLMLRIATLGELWLERRSLLLSLGAGLAMSLAAVSLNPHGPVMLLYPFRTVSIQVLQQYIQEWQSPDFHQLEVQPFLWLLLGTLVALALSRKGASATDLLLISVFAYMGFLAGRNIALFALVAAPVLSKHASSALEPILNARSGRDQLPERFTRVVNLLLFFLLLSASLVKVSGPLSTGVNEESLQSRMPVAAFTFLKRRRPPAPIFNSYNWGGYVLWDLYPRYRSFVDGRTDLFDDEILEDYLRAWRADEGWQQVLDAWNIQTVLIEPEAPLSDVLQRNGWQRIYSDDQATVLTRG